MATCVRAFGAMAVRSSTINVLTAILGLRMYRSVGSLHRRERWVRHRLDDKQCRGYSTVIECSHVSGWSFLGFIEVCRVFVGARREEYIFHSCSRGRELVGGRRRIHRASFTALVTSIPHNA